MTDPRIRRRHPRGTLNGVAQLSGNFGRATGVLAELSVGGAFIANVKVKGGQLPPVPESRVRLHLILPGSPVPVEMPSVVLYRREPSEHGEAGLGLRFCGVSAEDRERLETAVIESDARMMKLLFRLQMSTLNRFDLDQAAVEAGFPTGLTRDELERRVDDAIRRFRGS